MSTAHPAGFAILLTGLSGSGKSTLANELRDCLTGAGRSVTVLDGDHVRALLSSELGFSRADRDMNIRRIGFVATEVVRHGGIAVCAAIAPYGAAREELRAMVEAVGGFVLVHMTTPLTVCEQRDRKGLYARARSGQIDHVTGVSDPYEPPLDAAVTVDATTTTASEAAERILTYLRARGLLTMASSGLLPVVDK